jgi:guanine deaminase
MQLVFSNTCYIFDTGMKAGVGMLDFFDSFPVTKSSWLSLSMVEKWWSLGDVQNQTGVWVQGIKLAGE